MNMTRKTLTLAAMDELQWLFLLHALDIVPIKETYRRASLQDRLSIRMAVEALFENSEVR